MLMLSLCPTSYASENQIVEIVSEVVEDTFVELSEKEVANIPADLKVSEPKYTNLIMPRYIPNEKNFQKVGAKSHRIKLYGIDMFGVKIAAGTHDIDMTVYWYETWECDQYGNKIRFISSTSKKIAEATQDYHSAPGFDIWESDWDPGVRGNVAVGRGDIKSKLGTNSYTHRAYAN